MLMYEIWSLGKKPFSQHSMKVVNCINYIGNCKSCAKASVVTSYTHFQE